MGRSLKRGGLRNKTRSRKGRGNTKSRSRGGANYTGNNTPTNNVTIIDISRLSVNDIDKLIAKRSKPLDKSQNAHASLLRAEKIFGPFTKVRYEVINIPEWHDQSNIQPDHVIKLALKRPMLGKLHTPNYKLNYCLQGDINRLMNKLGYEGYDEDFRQEALKLAKLKCPSKWEKSSRSKAPGSRSHTMKRRGQPRAARRSEPIRNNLPQWALNAMDEKRL